MKKLLICNIPFTQNAKKSLYVSEDVSIPVSDTPVQYPVNAFFEKTLDENDSVKAVLIVKKDSSAHYKENLKCCEQELNAISEKSGAQIAIKHIYSDFDEKKSTHNKLLLDLISELEPETNIVVDMTYGPKDLPIIIFALLNFAEKFYECEIDNILYGKAEFHNNTPINTKICDMAPLYYINSITNALECGTPEEGKKIIKSLLSI